MKLFRDLNNEEQEAFRKWARENYRPFSDICGVWHPLVQTECIRMNIEAQIDFAKDKNIQN
jgi:hypothetical protein